MTGLQAPQTSPNGGLDHSDSALSEKQQSTPKSTGNIAVDATPRLEQIGEIPGNRSMTWDTELEDGVLPSESSSLVLGATVVIDTKRIWNLQDKMKQPLQIVVDSCGEQLSLTTKFPDESSRSPPRLASRFFSRPVSGSSLRMDTPRMPTPDSGGPPNWELVPPNPGGHLDCPCPDVRWDDSSGQETNLFRGDCCESNPSPLAGACMRGN